MKSLSSRSKVLILFAMILSIDLVSCNNTKASIKLPANVSIPAFFVFGDSIVDAGNNNNIKTIVKANFPPYGLDFNGGVPTGRFCDGKIPSDIVAEQLGLGDALPAYLDPNLQFQDLLTGVTFASGATGYDPLTPKLASVISLSQQLDYFKEYIEKLKGLVGEERANFIIANSLYLVVAGSDDIANTYFVLRARRYQYDIPSYTDLMVHSASNFLQHLYKFGARRIGVFSAPPIGCVPSQRTLIGGITRECAQEPNEAAVMFNSKLYSNMQSLGHTLPNSRLVYIDVYTSLADIIQNPAKYGFAVVDKGCCGTGALEVSILCNKATPVTCPNIADHVFWDSYHPTERAYRALVVPLLQKYVPSFY